MVTFSCKEQGLFVKYRNCTTEEPLKINLEIKIDINYYGSATLIKVYEDNLEDSVQYSSHNASGTNTTIPVTINKKYTVTASYYIPSNFYIAVDSTIPRVKYDRNNTTILVILYMTGLLILGQNIQIETTGYRPQGENDLRKLPSGSQFCRKICNIFL